MAFFERLREAIHEVIVVPRSAPSEKATAVVQSRMPAAPRPITMPIVADDEWIIAVTPAAISTHFKRLTIGIGLEGLQQRHDFGQVPKRAQAACHQVETVENQRETHAGERYVLTFSLLAKQ